MQLLDAKIVGLLFLIVILRQHNPNCIGLFSDIENDYNLSLNKINFIEFPKKGFAQLKKITNVLSKLSGCILLIDYGYLKSNNQDTLQSVYKHKRNNLLKNLGKADITSHVNFEPFFLNMIIIIAK